jgi:NAD(P)H-flavin reductase
MLPSPWQIRRVFQETPDTFTWELEAEAVPGAEDEPFSFLPGQFNMLYVFGVGEVPISISGDPANQQRLVHTTRAVGSVTKAMQKLKRADVIGVRGPFGSPWPVEEARGSDVVIVAGGLGLAPLRPALYRILAERQHYGRVALLYGARTPEDILYKKELEHLRARRDLEVGITVDRASDAWRGNVGVVTTLIPPAHFDPQETIALVCGPEIMMRFTIQALQKRGVPDEQIFVSMERNMKCALGFCGHCQYGPHFICKDGPVFSYSRIADWFAKREV